MSAPTMTPHTYRCDRCIWSAPTEQGRTMLHCRKQAPTRPVEGLSLAYWPVVRPDDWCGAFVPRRDGVA